jgi:IclR helix-turn-helix domain
MPDFLDRKRKEIDDRLQELRPVVEEAEELEEALAALNVVVNGRRAVRARRAAGTTNGRRRGRATASELEARRKRVLALIGSNPGIKVPNLALLLDLPKSTLYNFLRTLEVQREIAQDERGGYRLRSGS